MPCAVFRCPCSVESSLNPEDCPDSGQRLAFLFDESAASERDPLRELSVSRSVASQLSHKLIKIHELLHVRSSTLDTREIVPHMLIWLAANIGQHSKRWSAEPRLCHLGVPD